MIHEIVRNAERNYIDNPVDIGEYVEFDMHDTIETIDAYLNSKHTSGPTDSLGREKPFFNIVSAAVNVWYRATDIDRKNIRIMPSTERQTGQAFIATILLQQWMRDARFGTFLNDWGRTLARYGSAVTKFVEKGGELQAMVVPWNRIICDPIDFEALPRIEKIYATPSQLRKNKLYDQEVVKDLIQSLQSRENLDGTEKDDMDGFVEIYEVHGELDEQELNDADEPTENYVQQMHVIAYVQEKQGEYKDYTLYRGREKKDPYLLTHLIKEDGRTLSIGAVEYLFDSQWMVNHSQKNIKDTLDLASKLIFQTADSKYVGRNAIASIETGDIMIHELNKPLTRLSNDKPDITAFQNFSQTWQSLGGEITSTPEAIRGQTLPSGTPYSLGAYLGQQANSLFEIMTENKGLHLEDMMREFIIPNLKKKMDNKDEIVAILDSENVAELDARYVPRAAIRAHKERTKNALLNMDASQLQPFNREQEEQAVQQGLKQMGNMRAFKADELDEKSWQEALKDLEMTVTVEVTNENTDKQAVMQTLATLYTTTVQTDPVAANIILARIMQETGVFSPVQLPIGNSASTPQPQGQGADALQAITQTNEQTTQ